MRNKLPSIRPKPLTNGAVISRRAVEEYSLCSQFRNRCPPVRREHTMRGSLPRRRRIIGAATSKATAMAGQARRAVGLHGAVGSEHFARLSEGEHPHTEEQLVRHQVSRTYEGKFGREVTSAGAPRRMDARFPRRNRFL